MLRRDDEILVMERYDSLKDEVWTSPSMSGTPCRGKRMTASPFTALWKPITEFREGKGPLYPYGLMELVEAKD